MTENEVFEFWLRLRIAFIKNSKQKSFKQFCTTNNIRYQTLINQKSIQKYPSVKYLLIISRALNVSLDWLLLGKEDMPYSYNREDDKIISTPEIADKYDTVRIKCNPVAKAY